jgi:hypothetical protein
LHLLKATLLQRFAHGLRLRCAVLEQKPTVIL